MVRRIPTTITSVNPLSKSRKDKQSYAKSKYMYHNKCEQMQNYKATHARSWKITAILIIRTITKGYFDLT